MRPPSPSRAGGGARGGAAASPVGVAGGARMPDWALSERRVRRRRGGVGSQHAAAQSGKKNLSDEDAFLKRENEGGKERNLRRSQFLASRPVERTP